MKKLIEAIKSPNCWVYLASLSGLFGIILTIIGTLANSSQLSHLGLILLLPLLIGGLFLIVVIFPMLVCLNRKHRDNN